MPYLDTGEWWTANIGFGIVFMVAGIGVVLLGWYVVRGDRLNRSADASELGEDSLAPADPSEGH